MNIPELVQCSQNWGSFCFASSFRFFIASAYVSLGDRWHCPVQFFCQQLKWHWHDHVWPASMRMSLNVCTFARALSSLKVDKLALRRAAVLGDVKLCDGPFSPDGPSASGVKLKLLSLHCPHFQCQCVSLLLFVWVSGFSHIKVSFYPNLFQTLQNRSVSRGMFPCSNIFCRVEWMNETSVQKIDGVYSMKHW